MINNKQKIDQYFQYHFGKYGYSNQLSQAVKLNILNDARPTIDLIKKLDVFDIDWENSTYGDILYGNHQLKEGVTKEEYDNAMKYLGMSTENQRKLINSGWKTDAELQQEFEENQNRGFFEGLFERKPSYSGTRGAMQAAMGSLMALAGSFVGPGGTAAGIVGGVATGDFLADGFIANYERDRIDKNQNILDKIYDDDLLERKHAISSKVSDNYRALRDQNLTDDQINAEFNKLIENDFENGHIGNNLFKAYQGAEELEDFNINDKRDYIARYQAYTEAFDEETAADMLRSDIQHYINANQTGWGLTKDFFRDLGFKMANYSTAKIRGVLPYIAEAYDTYDNIVNGEEAGIEVWMTATGKIVPREKVTPHMEEGKEPYVTYTDPATGKTEEVHPTRVGSTALLQQGIWFDGTSMTSIAGFNPFNADYMNKVELYNTFDPEEIAQYDQLGYSPYKPMWAPGENTPFLYETGQMLSYGAVDMGTTFVLNKFDTAAKWMKVTGESGKFLKGAAKILHKTGNIGLKINPYSSALGIGNQYAETLFDETSQENLFKLDSKYYNDAMIQVRNKYNNDQEYKQNVDAKVKQEENKAYRQLQEQIEAAKEKGYEIDEQYIVEFKTNIQKGAFDKVINEEMHNAFKEMQDTPDYIEAASKAYDIAAKHALIMETTDGLKYAITNKAGYRKFMFKNQEAMTAEARTKIGTQSFGLKDVNLRHPIRSYKEYQNAKIAQQAAKLGKNPKTGEYYNTEQQFNTKWKRTKQFSKSLLKTAWGGGWTNGTDEMQMAAGRSMNEDEYMKYLNGEYDQQSLYDTIDSLFGVIDYTTAALEATTSDNTIRSFLVGAAGALNPIQGVNVSSLIKAMAHRRDWMAQYKASSASEKILMLFENGVISDYSANKMAEQEFNDMLDKLNVVITQEASLKNISTILGVDKTQQENKNNNSKPGQKIDDVSDKEQLDDLIRGIETVISLQEAANSSLGQFSPEIQQAISTIEALASEEGLTQKKAQELLGTYYAQNPSVARSQDKTSSILQGIQARAKLLNEIGKAYKDVQKEVDSMEKHSMQEYTPEYKSIITKRLAFDRAGRQMLAQAESALTDSTVSGNDVIKAATDYNPAVHGSALKVRVDKAQQAINELKALIKEEEEAIEKAKKKRKEIKPQKIKGQTRGESKAIYKAQIQDVDNQIIASQERIQSAKSLLSTTEMVHDHYKSYLDNQAATGEKEVLTSDQILQLDALSKWHMLNSDNARFYSEQQKNQIEQAKEKLLKQDKNALKKVKENALLYGAIEFNKASLDRMIANPKAAQLSLQAMRDHYLLDLDNYHSYTVTAKLIDSIHEIKEYFKGKGAEKTIKENISKLFTDLKDQIYLIQDNIPFFEELQEYAGEINTIAQTTRYKQVLQTLRFSETKGLDYNTQIKQFLDDIDTKTSTVEQIKEEFEQFIKNDQISAANRNSVKSLYEKLKQIEDMATPTYARIQTDIASTQERNRSSLKVLKEAAAQKSRENTEEAYEQHIKNVEKQSKTKTNEASKQKEGQPSDNKTTNTAETPSQQETSTQNNSQTSTESAAPSSTAENKVETKPIEPEEIKETNDNTGSQQTNDIEVETQKNQNGEESTSEKEKEQETKKEENKKENTQEEGKDKDKKDIKEDENEKSAEEDSQNTDKVVDSSSTVLVANKQGDVTVVSPEEDTSLNNAEQAETEILQAVMSDPVESAQEQIDSTSLIGNTLYIYDGWEAMKGIMVKRTGKQMDDVMNQMFKWLEDSNIALQEIIDRELADIAATNPKVELMILNSNKTGVEKPRIVLVVKYTDDIRKLHKQDYGGIITVGNQQYLTIGILGYAANKNAESKAQQGNYMAIHDKVVKKATEYFHENSDASYFIMPEMYTKIKAIGTGYTIQQLPTDETTVWRTIGSLLESPERNPLKMGWDNLVFGIAMGTKFKLTKGLPGKQVRKVRQEYLNSGQSFLMLRGSDGSYIPVYIKSTTAQDLKKNSELKSRVDAALIDLLSTDRTKQTNALTFLGQLFFLGGGQSKQGGATITITQDGVVRFFKNGSILETLNSQEITNKSYLIDLFYNKFNPRINLSQATLSNAEILKMLDEGGVLRTDIAMLGTINADFTVSQIDFSTGKPVDESSFYEIAKKKEVSKKQTPGQTNIQKNNYQGENTIYYPDASDRQVLYRYESGVWYREHDLEESSTASNSSVLNSLNAKDKELIAVLSALRDIITKQLKPIYKITGSPTDIDKTMKNWEVYLLDVSVKQKKIIFVSPQGKVVINDNQHTLDVINRIIGQQKADEKAAEQLHKIIGKSMENPKKKKTARDLISRGLKRVSTKSSTFTEQLKSNKEAWEAVQNKFKERDWDIDKDIEAKLKELKVQTEGVTDWTTWTETLKNCR